MNASFRSAALWLLLSCFGCASDGPDADGGAGGRIDVTGFAGMTGGSTAAAGATPAGGSRTTGGSTGSGGSRASGGSTSTGGATSPGGSVATGGSAGSGATGTQPLGAICANDTNCDQSQGAALCCRSTCTLSEQCPTSTTYLPCKSTADCGAYGGGKLCCEVTTSTNIMRFCTKQSACSGKVLP
ncbi:MAG TPA: hypothetical protein VG937_02330 [Polyangiaceae bacterium]|nr:hypothetical protein [Polyangiaceae bacterium]